MRKSNVISVLSAYKNLPTNLFQSYLDYHSINIKNDELNDLDVFAEHLKSLTANIEIFDNYFIGYCIPQIGKEFDLLRIGTETIVNIELKRESTNEKILKQLKRNKYYLSFLNKELINYTYVSSEKKLYEINDEGSLQEINIRQLIANLASQNIIDIQDIDKLFNPSDYLVSPFNSTQQFVRSKYFLTNHQEKIKNKVLEEITKPKYSVLAIKGKAGTGKTLLTYDIANEVYKTDEILVIHCGLLNNGHITLRDDYAWNIIAAKFLYNEDFSKYQLVIIDEAQRIYTNQLAFIIKEVKKHIKNCIFSYDGLQTLRSGEIRNKIASKIEENISLPAFELTTKIRTNKEVASFIQCLLNQNKPINRLNYSNIELNYFENHKVAKAYLLFLKTKNWKIINYTPSTVHTLPYESYVLDNEDNAHTVIGQEFDNVVAVIDSHFFYKNNVLSTRNYPYKPYYHPTKMLFQILSRTKIKLGLVIIDNQEVFERSLQILNKNTSTITSVTSK